MEILLPAQLNALRLLPFVSKLGQPLAEGECISIDFSGLQRITPAPLAALVATILRWHKEGRKIELRGLTNCSILAYLQRMDFFKVSGFEVPECFNRHNSKGRFVPIQHIGHEIDSMGSQLADCLAPGGEDFGHPMADLHSLSWYVFTEMANNVRQHSRGQGYVTAQVNFSEGLVRLAIADNGCGIPKSFQDLGFQWSIGMPDADCIHKALEPTISSKGSPVNAGVGLTLVSGLVKQTKGWLLIVSGQGVLMAGNDSKIITSKLQENARYQGTLVALTFKQQEISDYAALLNAAKIDAGLLQNIQTDVKFIP